MRVRPSPPTLCPILLIRVPYKDSKVDPKELIQPPLSQSTPLEKLLPVEIPTHVPGPLLAVVLH